MRNEKWKIWTGLRLATLFAVATLTAKLFLLRQFLGAPVNSFIDSSNIDRRSFDAFHAYALACFQRRLAFSWISRPGRPEDFYRAFLHCSAARGNDGADFTRQ